ncbi:uncharacterized protein EV420DRAFT_1481938 [Desarmillaria tabescens]|uniref:Peptidase C14 caspase domain-containing protein n=1 Tax=Armillaria tabescens TaxID=1929756 RepID=A0AA39N0J4_ARMTA|nr:uncharacterized protein EV420DRAFT_1481938 [Desarmillaria tabescens]KAK0452944.1 hypothetical protein EV420DRAFT_1481938 [Desarmillaria tabescens]
MFLSWLNITVTTVSDLIWYLVASPPPPTPAQDPAQENPPPPSPPQCIPIERRTPPLFALVIGIDKYHPDHGIKSLNGAVADADAVKEFLQKSLVVPEQQITILRNEQATRVNIETAIKDLGNNPTIKMGDPILIFYAGHGAEVNAPSGWHSTKRKIRMLLPYDFIPSGVSKMRTDSNDLSFAFRGIELPETYSIPLDLFYGIEPDAQASVAGEGFRKTGLSSHMLLSACKADQMARETAGSGIFTSALLNLLEKSGVDRLTYKDIIAKLPDLPSQNPQCKGEHQSRCLFNSKVASPQRELHLIRGSPALGQYILEAGQVHGITNKAEFIVFADRTMASALGTVVASVTTAFTTTCDFRPRGSETPFSLSVQGFALQTRVGEGQDVRLFIEKDEKFLGVFKRIGEEMQSDEAQKRGFCLVESREDQPDLLVAADGDLVHFEIMDKLCRQHGLTHMPFKVNIDPDIIHRILRSSADFYWHLHHSSQDSQLAGKVILECMKLKETGTFTQDLEPVLIPESNGDNLNIGASYYQPGSAKESASLNPKESLTIGYGDNGTFPHKFTVRNGQDVDVGFLKLFFSTEYTDLSDIAQTSPFEAARENGPVLEKKRYLLDTMCVALVSEKGRGYLAMLELVWGGGNMYNFRSYYHHDPYEKKIPFLVSYRVYL